MTKSELADKIRSAARAIASSSDKPDNATPMSLKYSDMLLKFPKLQETLSDLMSDDFTMFVDNIEWVAPRPTTFKITLKNKNFFYLIWNVNDFIARIIGTNHSLSSVGENERAIKSIQDLLINGPINPDKASAVAPPTEKENTPSEPPL